VIGVLRAYGIDGEPTLYAGSMPFVALLVADVWRSLRR
jgi:hypothetical protein